MVTKLGPARIAAMAAVTLVLIAFFAFVIMRVSQPAMGVLYADLSLQDASLIIRDLEAKGVAYEARADGQTILVPRSELARLRMDLASKGVPAIRPRTYRKMTRACRRSLAMTITVARSPGPRNST